MENAKITMPISTATFPQQFSKKILNKGGHDPPLESPMSTTYIKQKGGSITNTHCHKHMHNTAWNYLNKFTFISIKREFKFIVKQW